MIINLYCFNCATDLTIEVNNINYRQDVGLSIPVKICSGCIEAEKRVSYNIGYEEGLNSGN